MREGSAKPPPEDLPGLSDRCGSMAIMSVKQFFWITFGLALGGAMLFDGERSPRDRNGPQSREEAEAMLASTTYTPDPYAPARNMQDDVSFGEVRLSRQADGHFYARPMISGTEVAALVDTGAGIVALTAEDARAAGIFWNETDVRLIGRGASGDVYGVATTIDRIELNGLVAYQVPAAVIPEGLDVTLLGQSFLSRIDSVRIENDAMILKNE